MESLTVPVCVLFPLALVCPAALDLAWFSSLAIVADALSLSLLLEDALPLSSATSSLADALLPRVTWPFPVAGALP